VVFLEAWCTKLIDVCFIQANLWVTFFLGVLQTYVLGNEYGSLEELAPRFTTFSSPQALAVLFLVMFILILDLRSLSKHPNLSLILATVGIVMTGSRYVFFGFALFFLARIVLVTEMSRLRITIKKMGQLGLLIAGLLIVVVSSRQTIDLMNCFSRRFSGAIDTIRCRQSSGGWASTVRR